MIHCHIDIEKSNSYPYLEQPQAEQSEESIRVNLYVYEVSLKKICQYKRWFGTGNFKHKHRCYNFIYK